MYNTYFEKNQLISYEKFLLPVEICMRIWLAITRSRVLFFCFLHQSKAIPNLLAYTNTTFYLPIRIPKVVAVICGTSSPVFQLRDPGAPAFLTKFKDILRLTSLPYTPNMNNSSLAADCVQFFSGGKENTIEPNPDITGTGVRADLPRK